MRGVSYSFKRSTGEVTTTKIPDCFTIYRDIDYIHKLIKSVHGRILYSIKVENFNDGFNSKESK